MSAPLLLPARRADDVPLRAESETLSEQEDLPSRPLASLVTSKVYYHLGSLDEALTYALGAGKLFDLSHADDAEPTEREYVETIIGKQPLLPYMARSRWQLAREGEASEKRSSLAAFGLDALELS